MSQPFIFDNKEVISISLVDNYSKEALENIVSVSKTMAELVKNLGYNTLHGKNYETVQKQLDKLNISTEHFKPKKESKKLTENDIFCESSTVSQHALRKSYLRRNDIEYKCSECGIADVWNGKPITLQLDHIDGDNHNNLPENLRWLCPNCHSQTKTFAGKNVPREKNHYYCTDCGKEISRGAKRCEECAARNRTIQCPLSKYDLRVLLSTHNGSFKKVANIYDVSDNLVRKWCESLDLPTHSSDYKKPKEVKPKGKASDPCKVQQIDKKTGKVINTFSSITEAETVTGFHHIYEASNPNNKSRKSSGGYLWKRIE